MTTPAVLTVNLASLGPLSRRRHAAALASLPLSYRVGAYPSDVTTIDGSDRGWPAQAASAAQTGPRAIMVSRPVPAPVDQVNATIGEVTSAGVAVVLESRWAGHPGWDTAATRFAADMQSISYIEAVAIADVDAIDGAASGLLEIVRCLGRLSSANTAPIRAHQASVANGCAHTRLGRIPVTMLAGRGVGDELRIDAIGPSVRWNFTATGDAPAGALRVTRLGPDGEVGLPSAYDGTPRRSWVRLLTQLSSADAPGPDLHELARVARFVGQARPT